MARDASCLSPCPRRSSPLDLVRLDLLATNAVPGSGLPSAAQPSPDLGGDQPAPVAVQGVEHDAAERRGDDHGAAVHARAPAGGRGREGVPQEDHPPPRQQHQAQRAEAERERCVDRRVEARAAVHASQVEEDCAQVDDEHPREMVRHAHRADHRQHRRRHEAVDDKRPVPQPQRAQQVVQGVAQLDMRQQPVEARRGRQAAVRTRRLGRVEALLQRPRDGGARADGRRVQDALEAQAVAARGAAAHRE
eukprot:3749999-Prymnesium_polylepis.1